MDQYRHRIPDDELLAVLDARLAGRSLRLIAIDLLGEARVEEEWSPNGWMRARVRRRVKTALALMEAGRRLPRSFRHDAPQRSSNRRVATETFSMMAISITVSPSSRR